MTGDPRPSTARLFFTDTGRGRNVLLLHGWTCDSHDWSWQMPALEQRYRVVAPDLRGHGRSEVVPTGGYAIASYVADIEALIGDRFSDEPCVVVGHSMGGQIAALLASRRPRSVAGVVSIDGSLGVAGDSGAILRRAVEDLMAGDPGVTVPAMFDDLSADTTPAALKRWHARRVQGMASHVISETFGGQFFGPDQIGFGEESERFCRSLTTPVYHLCRDVAQAARMRPWFSHPRSRVEAWARTGHWMMQDRPEDLNATLIAWIDGL